MMRATLTQLAKGKGYLDVGDWNPSPGAHRWLGYSTDTTGYEASARLCVFWSLLADMLILSIDRLNDGCAGRADLFCFHRHPRRTTSTSRT